MTSRNFGFLGEYDPLLVEYGLRAEAYAYSDPNASLIKSRQFAEVLAKSTAYHAGMDCRESTFERTVGLLKRQRLIPRDVAGFFDHLRLAGNTAAHAHNSDRNAALQSLIGAYELARWFKRVVLNEAGFDNGPFRPPLTPEDANRELKEESEFLRNEAVRYELAASATESEIRELSKKLELEAAQYKEELVRQESDFGSREAELLQLERDSRERLRQVTAVATSESFQSFVNRNEVSSFRLGERESGEFPLVHLRILSGNTSNCCKAPMIITQSRSGGLVKQNCPECNSGRSLSREDFYNLNIYVACGKCRQQTKPDMIGINYGYRCPHCYWVCELVSLVPHYSDIEPL
jgi:hypothetical protein